MVLGYQIIRQSGSGNQVIRRSGAFHGEMFLACPELVEWDIRDTRYEIRVIATESTEVTEQIGLISSGLTARKVYNNRQVK